MVIKIPVFETELLTINSLVCIEVNLDICAHILGQKMPFLRPY